MLYVYIHFGARRGAPLREVAVPGRALVSLAKVYFTHSDLVCFVFVYECILHIYCLVFVLLPFSCFSTYVLCLVWRLAPSWRPWPRTTRAAPSPPPRTPAAVCEKTLLLGEPLPCSPEAETASQSLIWSSGNQYSNVDYFLEECFLTDTGIFREGCGQFSTVHASEFLPDPGALDYGMQAFPERNAGLPWIYYVFGHGI